MWWNCVLAYILQHWKVRNVWNQQNSTKNFKVDSSMLFCVQCYLECSFFVNNLKFQIKYTILYNNKERLTLDGADVFIFILFYCWHLFHSTNSVYKIERKRTLIYSKLCDLFVIDYGVWSVIYIICVFKHIKIWVAETRGLPHAHAQHCDSLKSSEIKSIEQSNKSQNLGQLIVQNFPNCRIYVVKLTSIVFPTF